MPGKTLYSLFFARWLVIAAACCLAFALTVPAQAQQSVTATTTVSLNMRTGPGTGYTVILAIPAGARVGVTQCTTAQTWCEVAYNNRVGWSAARYLNFSSPGYSGAASGDPEPAPPVAGQVPARTTVTLNMRRGPSTSYAVIRAIPAGATVGVTRCTDGYTWCEVVYAGSTGWAAARYLTSTSSQYPQQPIPNVGAALGLQLFQFILGQIAGQQPTPPQPQPGPQTPGANEICFYRDFDFNGPATCVRMGQSDASLGANWNDTISSIRLGQNARVEVCQDFNFGGTCRTFTSDVARLGGPLNDQISSFRTTTGGNNPPPTAGRACFYADWNYQGELFCLQQGANIAFLSPAWNDRISSIRIEPGVTVDACREANYGACDRFTTDVPVLADFRNDAISSIRIQ